MMPSFHVSICSSLSRAVGLLALAALLAMPAPAVANNGNGKGNGGDRGASGDRGRSDERGRGDERGNRGGHGNGRDIAPGQNRSSNRSSPAAVTVTVPDGQLSRPLADYRSTVLVARQAIAEQNAAAVEYRTLIDLSQREIVQVFPNGGYNAALETARVRYEQATARAHMAQGAVEAALQDVAGSRSVPASTQAELHRRLGL